MKRWLSLVLTLAFLYIGTQPVWAQNSITLRPGESIQAAVNEARSGDVILLESGTWREHVLIRTPGITLAAAPGAEPVLDGEYRLPGGEAVNCDPRTGNCFVYSPLLAIQASDVVVDGLTVQRSRGRGIGVHNGAENVTVRNCTIRSVRNAGFHVTNASFVTFERCTVTDAANYAPYSRSAKDVNWPVIVNVVSASDVTIRLNHIYLNWGEGIAAGRNSRRVQILNNHVHENYALQIYVHRTQDTSVVGNLVYHTANYPDYFRGGTRSDCIVVNAEANFTDASPTRNVNILNNIIGGCGNNIALWGNGGTGLPTENVLIAHNTAVAGVDSGLLIQNGQILRGVRIVNNIIDQTSGGVLVESPALLGSGVTFSSNAWSGSPPANVTSPSDLIDRFYTQPLGTGALYAESVLIPQMGVAGAVDGGAQVDVWCDYFGNGRDALPDIGAVEAGAEAAADCPEPVHVSGYTAAPIFLPSALGVAGESVGNTLATILVSLILPFAVIAVSGMALLDE